MSNPPHRIRRLRCLVATSSQTEAFAMRQNLRDRWEDDLLPVFEGVFDDIASGDRIIHIPKIELHLKITHDQELMEVLPELIQQQLTERLQAMNWDVSLTTQPRLIGQEATTQQSQFDVLLHYLRTGSVPWQTVYASAPEIAVDLKETCRQQRSQLMSFLAHQPESASVYFRLLQLLSRAESLAVVDALSDRFSPEWRTAITEFIRFVLDTGQSRLTSYTQWQLVAVILSECLSRSQPPPRPDFNRIVDSVISQAGIDHNVFITVVPTPAAVLFQPQSSGDHPSSTANPFATENPDVAGREAMRSPQSSPMPGFEDAGLLTGGDASNLSLASNVRDANTTAPRLEANASRDEPSSQTENLDAAGSEAMRSPQLSPMPGFEDGGLLTRDDASNLSSARRLSDANRATSPFLSHQEAEFFDPVIRPAMEVASTEKEFPLFVNYAGLVLLHPFISLFFEATGVREAGSQAIATAQMVRAAALLHYLATGQEELYEYELSLIKILLGLEPETPLLVGQGLLQAGDREEAETVLQSIINYWSVLKNTSVDGLRASFIQRSGLLRKTDNGWEMQVEHQSFDLLLEHLPWSISVVKLPWMKYPLYTEWQTL